MLFLDHTSGESLRVCVMPVVDTATATGPQALGTATDARWSLWWGRTISRTGDVVVSEGGGSRMRLDGQSAAGGHAAQPGCCLLAGSGQWQAAIHGG